MRSSLQSDGQDVETRLHREEVVHGLWEKVIIYCYKLTLTERVQIFKYFLWGEVAYISEDETVYNLIMGISYPVET